VSVSAPEIEVLVVEDGNEYMTNFTTFVAAGIRYVQAQSGGAACELALRGAPDVVYLDMRFDRTPIDELLGDLVALTARFNGDVARARAFLQDNQGLFILRALRDAGYSGPVILSYDFSAEERRFRALTAKDPGLSYCPDYADARTIRAAILRAIGAEAKAGDEGAAER
jgi:DNA-binding NarL/FixJ family response regulator